MAEPGAAVIGDILNANIVIDATMLTEEETKIMDRNPEATRNLRTCRSYGGKGLGRNFVR